jgi:hypothetical protein
MKMLRAASGIVGVAMGVAGLAGATPPRAPGCTATLVICMNDAAELPTFFQRTVAGLDCNIEYSACVYNLFH